MSIAIHASLILFFLASFYWVGGKLQDIEQRVKFAILAPVLYWVVGSLHALYHYQLTDIPWLAVSILIPAVLMLGVREEEVNWVELLALLVLVLPFKFGVIRNAAESCKLPVNIWSAAFAAVHIFVLRHRWTNVEWTWKFNKENIGKTFEGIATVTVAFLILLFVLTPIGYFTGFLSLRSWDAINFKNAPILFLGIFTARAFGEEVVRAIMQDWFKEKFGLPVVEVVLSAVIFGLFHLSSASRWAGWESLSWTYAGLAFGAGLGYAIVYRLCETMWAPVLLHTLVDWNWVMWFVTRFK